MIQLIRKLVRATGFDLIRYNLSQSRDARLQHLLKMQGINLVLDVGANTGQYAVELFAGGYSGRIVSFEPGQAAYQQLARKARNNPQWQVAERCALGAEPGTIALNLSQNSVSSSVLPLLPLHAEADPQSVYVQTEEVQLTTLDEVAKGYIKPADKVLVKIDTQGYEAAVLTGAKLTLPNVKGLQLELSLVPLYEGQPLMEEILEITQKAGFTLFGLTPGFTHPETARMLQMDGIFFRQ